MLRSDSVLLICGLWKTEFRGNFGAILNFPGIPNERVSLSLFLVNKDRLSSNLGIYVFLILNFIVLFQVIFALPCVLFLLNASCLGIINQKYFEKRGDVKTLARFSISPLPQIKVKLKLTTSR